MRSSTSFWRAHWVNISLVILCCFILFAYYQTTKEKRLEEEERANPIVPELFMINGLTKKIPLVEEIESYSEGTHFSLYIKTIWEYHNDKDSPWIIYIPGDQLLAPIYVYKLKISRNEDEWVQCRQHDPWKRNEVRFTENGFNNCRN